MLPRDATQGLPHTGHTGGLHQLSFARLSLPQPEQFPALLFDLNLDVASSDRWRPESRARLVLIYRPSLRP